MAIDDETGEQYRLRHGHYVAHEPNESGWDDDAQDEE